MPYQYIPWILEHESGSDFQSVHQNWRPKHLFLLRQVQIILKDIRTRYDTLELAREELATLAYAEKYLRYLQRMRIWIRDANFSWRADQLRFIKSVAGFYSDYGAILRLLRLDKLRGKFPEPEKSETNTIGV